MSSSARISLASSSSHCALGLSSAGHQPGGQVESHPVEVPAGGQHPTRGAFQQLDRGRELAGQGKVGHVGDDVLEEVVARADLAAMAAAPAHRQLADLTDLTDPRLRLRIGFLDVRAAGKAPGKVTREK